MKKSIADGIEWGDGAGARIYREPESHRFRCRCGLDYDVSAFIASEVNRLASGETLSGRESAQPTVGNDAERVRGV